MRQPGTKITSRRPTTRTIDGVTVEETVLRWNATEGISVDYRAGDVEMFADPTDCTSFDEPLSDSGLRDLLATYGVRGFKLAVSDPSALVRDMLEVAVGRLSEHDTEEIALVAAMLDAVLEEEAKAARSALDIVRGEITEAH
jgi:hypothetical protein